MRRRRSCYLLKTLVDLADIVQPSVNSTPTETEYKAERHKMSLLKFESSNMRTRNDRARYIAKFFDTTQRYYSNYGGHGLLRPTRDALVATTNQSAAHRTTTYSIDSNSSLLQGDWWGQPVATDSQQ